MVRSGQRGYVLRRIGPAPSRRHLLQGARPLSEDHRPAAMHPRHMQLLTVHAVPLRLRREISSLPAEHKHRGREHARCPILQRHTGHLFQGETSLLAVAKVGSLKRSLKYHLFFFLITCINQQISTKADEHHFLCIIFWNESVKFLFIKLVQQFFDIF